MNRPAVRRMMMMLATTISCTLLALGRPAAGATPADATVAFTETFSDKEVCGAGGCSPVSADSYTVTAVLSLGGVDITQFDTNTLFLLSLGNVGVTNRLGDDPRFGSSKSHMTSAAFPRAEIDEKGRTVVYQTVLLKWSATKVSVSVKGKTADYFHSNLVSLLALKYNGHDSGVISDAVSGAIVFGPQSALFSNVTVTGSVVTKPKTARDGSQVLLSNIKIKGAATGVLQPTPGP